MSSRRLLSNSNRARGRPSAASSSSRQSRPVEIPDYEEPSCPLDTTARQALAELANNQSSHKYLEQLDKSLKLLQKSVGDINDRFSEQKELLKKTKSRREERSDEGHEKEKGAQERALEKAVAELRNVVPDLTSSSDAAVRELLDWKIELTDGKEALQETKRLTEMESANANAAMADQAADEEEEEQPQQISVTGPLKYLAQEQEKRAMDYASKSLYQRYGLNNDYVEFKRWWHDSIHGQDRKPLPDATRWFDEEGEGTADDDDDDVVVEEEVIDLHCPLSLRMMKEPYFAPNKCKHTFEKAAIYEYLNPYPRKTARCPQTGCDAEISKTELVLNEIVLRKIKRAEASQARDDDDEDEANEGDETNIDGDTSMLVTSQRSVKQERDSRGRRHQLTDDIEGEE